MFGWMLLCLSGALVQSRCTQLVDDDSGGRDIYYETTKVDTMCQIDQLQLAATAKATVTRALKGFCNPKTVEEHFKRLEKLLNNQLELLKQLELKVDQAIKNNTILKSNGKSEDVITTVISRDGEEWWKGVSRELEIRQYNGTVYHDRNGQNVFTYYWKWGLAGGGGGGELMRSDNFYVTEGGYCMYLTLLATQATVYIKVGLTHGKFDETLLWPFRLKHQLSVLDQMRPPLNQDINSTVWDPSTVCSHHHWQKPSPHSDNYQCVGIPISTHLLHTRHYLLNNTLIIKLTVHLE